MTTSPSLLGHADTTQYNAQLNHKIEQTQQEFSAYIQPEQLDVFASPPSHFRMRAEFKIWHEGDIAFYAMYSPGESKKAIKIEHEFSIGSKAMTTLMPPLLAEINTSTALKHRLFQIEFLTSQAGECLVTLIYHRPLNTEWEEHAIKLGEKFNIQIIGRSRKQKHTLHTDHIHETFKVGGETYTYKQVESGFTQPNAAICEKMLNWAVEKTAHLSGDLVELYCGNANFTLPLSKNFGHVIATEISKTSVRSALSNITGNNIHNIDVLRMSSEEFTQALNKEREFRRLKDIHLDEYNFTTLFLDPPRAGLDEATLKLASQFKHIIYISCNPETLQHNIKALSNTHHIESMALFDQFPYTDHRECGVILTQK